GSSKRHRVGRLQNVECIEAGAQQEQELVAKDLAGSPQLSSKAITLAQHARLAVGAPVLVGRKYQGDEREVCEMRLELGDVAIVGPDHANRLIAAPEIVGIGE